MEQSDLRDSGCMGCGYCESRGTAGHRIWGSSNYCGPGSNRCSRHNPVAELLASIALGQHPPETMAKVTVRHIPEASFAAKPKTMSRAGNGYCRTEELMDRDQGIHGLMIINEPDVWMVNLLGEDSATLRDPGPTFNC